MIVSVIELPLSHNLHGYLQLATKKKYSNRARKLQGTAQSRPEKNRNEKKDKLLTESLVTTYYSDGSRNQNIRD
jgi:disulfide oxidoreductase YuzD